MIELDCIQGSDEWFTARLGIPTSSKFKHIVTGLGAASKSAPGYMNQLLADWLAGCPTDDFKGNHWTEQGNEREDTARAAYEFTTGNEVRQVGFVYLNKEKLVGASPDGLTGDDGCLEIKCPKASTLVGYYGGGLPTKYVPQVQGQLWVTGREWCDFYVHHPDLYPFLIRVERDEAYIKILAEGVASFTEKMLARREELKEWRVQCTR
jgi:predicted phage-related endonuclease